MKKGLIEKLVFRKIENTQSSVKEKER